MRFRSHQIRFRCPYARKTRTDESPATPHPPRRHRQVHRLHHRRPSRGRRGRLRHVDVHPLVPHQGGAGLLLHLQERHGPAGVLRIGHEHRHHPVRRPRNGPPRLAGPPSDGRRTLPLAFGLTAVLQHQMVHRLRLAAAAHPDLGRRRFLRPLRLKIPRRGMANALAHPLPHHHAPSDAHPALQFPARLGQGEGGGPLLLLEIPHLHPERHRQFPARRQALRPEHRQHYLCAHLAGLPAVHPPGQDHGRRGPRKGDGAHRILQGSLPLPVEDSRQLD